MKLAILSDIHGNHYALEAVLKVIDELGIQKLLVPGDIVGYYFYPNKVIELLKERDFVFIKGNHEIFMESLIKNQADRERYLPYLNLSEDQIQFLSEAPFDKTINIDGLNFYLCHGSPREIDEYIYPDAQDDQLSLFTKRDEDIFIHGHTHYQSYFERDGKIIINPGSVGQPRDYKPGAAWAIFDTETKEVKFRRESYDYTELFKDIDKFAPSNDYLKAIQLRTRD